MIQKFRYKFIAISTLALVVVIVTIIGSISALTYYHARREVDDVLTILVDNEGQIPAHSQIKNYAQPQFSREGLHQYRYFSVIFGKNNHVAAIEDDHITSIDPRDARVITQRIMQKKRQNGQLKYHGMAYAYKVQKKGQQTTIVVLDESLLMDRTRDLLHSGLLLGAIVLVLYTLILTLYSRRAIRPIIQAEQRQKQFITNASHELKTPLTVIAANTEMQEMLSGETEWTKSTHQQVQRLTHLINNLVALARMQEQPQVAMTPVNVSHLAQNVGNGFNSVLEAADKQFLMTIAPDVVVRADQNRLRELLNILLDNASKYCDPRGMVKLTVRPGKYGKTAVITVANSYQAGKDVDYRRFFDRFYRGDESHSNHGKSGFGIGLSMAQDIVHSMKGKISAKYNHGMLAFVITMKLAS
ncbi:MAG TPA: HAMP domain-containing histidine kinase [Candidatus Limosilactobacillus intestinigallinarum]|jgi:signal transduction histidine kinase|nr:HAMP domain-containing histidine kinase [Candidatus Limosilactobacillus intestinigallinarum]